MYSPSGRSFAVVPRNFSQFLPEPLQTPTDSSSNAWIPFLSSERESESSSSSFADKLEDEVGQSGHLGQSIDLDSALEAFELFDGSESEQARKIVVRKSMILSYIDVRLIVN
jgi:hypothetical protein